jgi:hypothetical protein
VRPRLQLNVAFTESLNAFARVRYYTFQDYAGTTDAIWDAMTGLGYDMTSNFGVDGFYSTKNKTYSNSSLFDQENSFVGLMLRGNI